jgi:hypothetical protein
MLPQRSKRLVDTIFDPLSLRRAIISLEERKTINNFMKKIDPRTSKQNNINTRLQLF